MKPRVGVRIARCAESCGGNSNSKSNSKSNSRSPIGDDKKKGNGIVAG
jgi:hypothetical protein